MSKALEELKRIRQETCPATYMQDFDKEKSCDIIEKELKFADTMKHKLERWLELLESDGINSKNMVATDIQQLLEEIEK